MIAVNRLGERCEAAEANVERLEKELSFYHNTEKGKLRAAYIRLQTFAQLVSNFCANDSDGHMKYLKGAADRAMTESEVTCSGSAK